MSHEEGMSWTEKLELSVRDEEIRRLQSRLEKLERVAEAAKPFGMLGFDVPDDAIVVLFQALAALEKPQQEDHPWCGDDPREQKP